ncbi:sensor histidine kinase [Actinoplanes sp. N902-109]|uniref:sensor histidine kinase n=1 Tax=Actinoplanes sp. (strain N902-109) TaxID=649831 RepID=UPI000329446E|nr:histidine kinase [Actinoplanes sp. N902-109]AGL18337.1 integral membrane sensor signal transduction histidine kinase [Actinoplanes sp. N902-109]
MADPDPETAEQEEYRFLLPAVMRGNPVRTRTMRDWAIDTVCFSISLLWTIVCSLELLSSSPSMVESFGDTPRWLVWIDLVIGVAFSAALWGRRRWPVALAVAAMVVGLFSVTVAPGALIAVFTVAVHRRFVIAMWTLAGGTVSSAVFTALRPEQGSGYVESFSWSVALTIIVELVGMVVRARRMLVVSLRERAERAESEQQLRVAQAQAVERTRIAREMHDVLAHRISLISLHAGAIEMRSTADTVTTRSAGVIRTSAHQAMQELREVIGVLREPAKDQPPEPPQPTLGELPSLAAESQAAGVKVRLDMRVEKDREMPVGTGRTAYRIVQEGLTNARKHAPGTAVRVAVGGAAGEGLTINIRNPAPVGGPGNPLPGTGTGLIGLVERATLAGGTLTHGRDPGGDFVLAAWLPWPS